MLEEKARLANITEKIRYAKNGYVTPVDENRQEVDSLPKLCFTSDKNDPTLVSLPENSLEDEKYELEKADLTGIDPAKNFEAKYLPKHKYVTINRNNPHFDINPGPYCHTVIAIVRYKRAGDKSPKDSIQIVQ